MFVDLLLMGGHMKLVTKPEITNSEHKQIKAILGDLESMIVRLEKDPYGLRQLKSIQRIKREGTYLVCLLKNHLWVEDDKMMKSLERELHRDEKKKLSLMVLPGSPR